jgi:hypothetical protein
VHELNILKVTSTIATCKAKCKVEVSKGNNRKAHMG